MNIYKEKELELYNRYKQGDHAAKVELLSSLKPLINRSVSKFSNSGLPLPAMRLEGTRLASEALKTYDPSKSQLNTHVTNHLKKMSRFVGEYQNVGHIPEPRILMIGKYNANFSNLEAEKGREPTVAELADAMNISMVEVERLQTELRKDLSLTLDEDKDTEGGFYEFAGPQSDFRLKQIAETVYFESDPVDKKILEYTLGLYGSPKYSNIEIAKKLKLTSSELNKRKVNLIKQIRELY